MNTPWGFSDFKQVYAKGIVFYSTPSHGGFKIDKHLNDRLPDKYRNNDGWYEEDCEVIKVILSFPYLFKPSQVEYAQTSFSFWYNDDGSSKSKYLPQK